MKTTKLISCGILMMLLFTVSIIKAQPNTLSISGGDWETAAYWSLGHVPSDAESVIIPDNYTVKINSAAVCNRLDIGDGTTGTYTSVTIYGSNSLDVPGGIFIQAPLVNGIARLDVGAGTLNAGGILLQGIDDGNSSHIAELAIGTGTVNIISNNISGNGYQQSRVVLYGAGTINVGGHISDLTEFTGFAGSTVIVNGNSNDYIYNITTFTTNSGNFYVDGDISNITTFDASSSTINIGGSMTGITSFTCGTGTVNYNGTSPQKAAGLTYYNLTIDNTAGVTLDADATVNNTLTVNPAGELTVSGTLNNNGTVAIKSDATGTGSLIVASVSGIGTASAERYMTGNIWHLVSPIATGGSVSTFIQAAGNSIPLSGSNYGMMDYNETTNVWNNYFTTSTSGNFTTGKGYGIRRSSDGVVTFTGTLTTGTNTVAITKGGTEGWNLIGNPYSSSIYMNTAANATYNFLQTNAIDASKLDPSYACIYLWDVASNSYKILGNTSYSDRDLGINVFAPGQAFFVKAAAAGTIEFNKNMQVQQTNTAFKAPDLTSSWPGITLTATSATISSSAIITFNENMTNGLDPTYDAGLLRGTNGLSLYTQLLEDNGVDFAVQCLPENYNNLVIPVGLDCKDGGEITFNAQTVDLPAACNVILEDRTTKTFTTLTGSAAYKTTVLAGTTDIGRFYIRTGTDYTTGTAGLTAGISSLKAYTFNGAIIIEGEVSDQAIATLYDLQGLKVLVHSLQKGSLNILSCPDLMNGIYLLTIQQDGEIVTRKLIMK